MHDNTRPDLISRSDPGPRSHWRCALQALAVLVATACQTGDITEVEELDDSEDIGYGSWYLCRINVPFVGNSNDRLIASSDDGAIGQCQGIVNHIAINTCEAYPDLDHFSTPYSVFRGTSANLSAAIARDIAYWRCQDGWPESESF